MATEKATTFTLAVSKTLQYWSVLRIAIQHGFGGNNAKEKEEWLYESVVQIFNDNGLVYPDELEDFISEALFNEFDTIVEDGSLKEICQTLCKYYQLCDAEQFHQVSTEVESMVTKNASIATAPISVQGDDHDDDDDDDGDASDNETASSRQIEQRSNNEQMDTDQSMDVDEGAENEKDGWEVVRRSKKR